MKTQKLDSKIFHIVKNIRIAVLVMGTAILLFACNNNEIQKMQAFQSTDDLPILEANNFETMFTDSGQVRFSLKTKKLLRFANEGKAYHEFPVGVQIIKYDEQQNIISSITADYAKEFIKEEKWEAKNNVVVTNANGDSLKTEHLIWEQKAEKIHTEEFVKIISDSRVITGVGLTSDQNMMNWKIKNPKGTLYIDVKEKEPRTSQSEQNTNSPIQKNTKAAPEPIKFK